jgi:hypothetical protein
MTCNRTWASLTRNQVSSRCWGSNLRTSCQSAIKRTPITSRGIWICLLSFKITMSVKNNSSIFRRVKMKGSNKTLQCIWTNRSRSSSVRKTVSQGTSKPSMTYRRASINKRLSLRIIQASDRISRRITPQSKVIRCRAKCLRWARKMILTLLSLSRCSRHLSQWASW